MRRKTPPSSRRQSTPQELRDDLLAFLERKFYPTHHIAFLKDRTRLLDWVVLWPAKWFDDRGVTVPADRYKAIFMGVFLDGLRFGNTGNITYLPAWLAKVIQSHFAMHGEEYYEQAKDRPEPRRNNAIGSPAHRAAHSRSRPRIGPGRPPPESSKTCPKIPR